MSKRKTILVIIVAVLLLTILIIAAFLWLAGKDEPKPNDMDLIPQNVKVATEENAFGPLMLAASKINASSEDFNVLNGTSESGVITDMSRVKSIIDKNQEALDLFDQALTYPKFQDEMCKDISDVNLNSILYSRPEITKISKMALLRAMYNFKSGQEEKAMSQTLAIASLGHRIENSQCVIIIYLVGQSVKARALSAFIDFTNQTNLSSATLKKYIPSLSLIEDSRDSLAYSLKLEYLSSVNTKAKFFDAFIAKAEIKLLARIPYFYKPNKTSRIIADNYRNMINNAKEVFFKDIKKPNLDMAEISVPKGNFLVENIVGRMYLNVALVSFNPYSKATGDKFLVSGSQALLALKSYWQDYKKLPQSLSELVPAYLPEIPKDPFDGNLIRYSTLKNMLYSVGADLIESGGANSPHSILGSKYLEEPTINIKFSNQ
jgi:predicted negative regulator of RcsB-dependent stress response